LSFSTRSSFSTNYWTLDSVQLPVTKSGQQAAQLASTRYVGSRGSGSWISVSHSTSVWDSRRSRGLAAGKAGGLLGTGSTQSEKTMQCLNDDLASYMERVRSLEADNWILDIKFRNTWRKRDPRSETGGIISKTTEDKTHIVLLTDDVCPAAADFRVKYVTELAMR
ncbi:Keratin, type I cytoskeletal 18, partial [Myotis davidii]